MQLSAAIFSDPTQRAGLEKYYEKQKASTIEALKAREADPEFQTTFNDEVKMPNRTTKTLNGTRMTAEMAEKSFVSFDKWAEIMADTYESQANRFEKAQQRLDMLQAESPDSSSNVRTTFSANGQLLAYINADGSLVTFNIGPSHDDKAANTALELKLQAISSQADTMGLSGQRRIDYLNREVKNALSQEMGNVSMTSYDSATSPTKREFGKMWQANFNVDQVYSDALADAQTSYKEAKAWHDQWQSNMTAMNRFLLSLQESA